MKVCVVGLGYIGLPTALMFADSGLDVIGVDKVQSVVNSLAAGKLTFTEDGMQELFSRALGKSIKFSTDYPVADIYIIAVPTPYNKESKRIDSSYVISATKSVLEVCGDEAIIVVESTISPGTVDNNVRPLIQAQMQNTGMMVHIAHAPERIIPGNMIAELTSNSRTIGADCDKVARKLKDIYSLFCKSEIILTDIRTAEMSKVVENTFRDINIAFANELAKICDCADLDVHEVIKVANFHPRVNILSPGPGVGGHCISVDPWFLVGDYPSLANLIWEARRINDSMPEYVLSKMNEIMKANNISDVSKVGIYGLTYKENVDDLRESPSLQLFESMEKHLGDTKIRAYDPYVLDNVVPNQFYSLESFLDGLELIVVMVSHSEILSSQNKLKDMAVFDTRNCLSEIKAITL